MSNGTPIDINDKVSLFSEETLEIGKKSVDGNATVANTNVANLAYFNVVLDPAVIANNFALKDVNSHYANFVGF